MTEFGDLYDQVMFFEALRRAVPELADGEARQLWKVTKDAAQV